MPEPTTAAASSEEDPMPTDPMPVFVIKAKDNLAPGAIAAYALLCAEHGLAEQARSVRASLAEVVAWRDAHRDLCEWPDHEHIPAGLPGSGSEATDAD